MSEEQKITELVKEKIDSGDVGIVKGIFKPFEADFFIIPNNGVRGSEMIGNSFRALEKSWAQFGVKVDIDDMFIQTWFTTEDHDTISDHGLPDEMIGLPCEEIRGGFHQARWAHHVPVELVKELKEGESITLTSDKEVSIKITAAQKKYRYKGFGSFEDTLKTVVARGK